MLRPLLVLEWRELSSPSTQPGDEVYGVRCISQSAERIHLPWAFGLVRSPATAVVLSKSTHQRRRETSEET